MVCDIPTILLLSLLDILILIRPEMKKIENSTFGACFFIGDCLVAWLSKKQNFIPIFTTKAKYIVSESYRMQLLWIKQMLKDYGIKQRTMNIHYDNSKAINISKNLVFHSWTK